MLNSARDYRLDFARGFCLAIILWNHALYYAAHLNIVQPVHWLWLRLRLDLSDAAEAFIFVAGLATGIFLRNLWIRGQLSRVAPWALRRCAKIWIAHLLTIVAVFVALQALTQFGQTPHYLSELSRINPLRALLLLDLPPFIRILPIYVVFMIGTPALAWLLTRSIPAALLISIAIYLAAQPGTLQLLPAPTPTWTFSPAAWQILFCVGAILSFQQIEIAKIMGRHRAWLWIVSLALIGYVLFKRLPYSAAHSEFALTPDYAEKTSLGYILSAKRTLGPKRILHFALVVLCVSGFWYGKKNWQPGVVGRWFVSMGQHSLFLFCFGLWWAIVSVNVVQLCKGGAFTMLSVIILGIILSILLAQWLDRLKKSPQAPPNLENSI